MISVTLRLLACNRAKIQASQNGDSNWHAITLRALAVNWDRPRRVQGDTGSLVDVIQCSQQLNSDELSTIFSQLLSVNIGSATIVPVLIAPSAINLTVYIYLNFKISDFWDITHYNLLKVKGRFGGTCLIHL
jgi:hypothetical protein